MSHISSIDDLLMGVGNSQQPATPEHKEKVQEQNEPIEEIDNNEVTEYEDDIENDHSDDTSDDRYDSDDDQEDNQENERDQTETTQSDDEEVDDYGNKKERMPRGMEERLARKDKQYQQEVAQRDHEIAQLRAQLASQGASREVQQAVKDFEYNPNNEQDWQQQLSDFVKHTVTNMHHEQQQQQISAREQYQEMEFRKKFTQGMERFGDFREVVGKLPMDDDMTRALRGMDDPTAFIYAAAKRQPGEIERIAKLADPYKRMVEMGKLEERMRRNKPTTKAPRPLGRTREDATTKIIPKEKEATGDDLLAKADAKRLATVRNRHRSNR